MILGIHHLSDFIISRANNYCYCWNNYWIVESSNLSAINIEIKKRRKINNNKMDNNINNNKQ